MADVLIRERLDVLVSEIEDWQTEGKDTYVRAAVTLYDYGCDPVFIQRFLDGLFKATKKELTEGAIHLH